jgi:L-ascorbate metabolism protein UlaG (beta-lactamase superfamily)
MEHMSVINLGVAALDMNLGTARILVDAFNSINEAPSLREGDILLFTHDDADHFDASKIPCLKGRSVAIIGPPTIVHPLLVNDKASLEQITTMYSPNNREPISLNTAGIFITCFQTPHFLNWKPIHNSYLIRYKNYSVYITGDSYLDKTMKDVVGNIDMVICNLVEEGYITCSEDKRFAVHHLFSYLLHIMAAYNPKTIVGVHLMDFDGTIDASDLKKLVSEYQFSEIIIPTQRDETIALL